METERFISTNFGYCFYTLYPYPLIYNLYVFPEYRKKGNSKTLLCFCINEIKKSGYYGKIKIQAEPKENSISQQDLIRYYKNMGLSILTTAALKEQEANDEK